jgi:hypothetical protein
MSPTYINPNDHPVMKTVATENPPSRIEDFPSKPPFLVQGFPSHGWFTEVDISIPSAPRLFPLFLHGLQMGISPRWAPPVHSSFNPLKKNQTLTLSDVRQLSYLIIQVGTIPILHQWYLPIFMVMSPGKSHWNHHARGLLSQFSYQKSAIFSPWTPHFPMVSLRFFGAWGGLRGHCLFQFHHPWSGRDIGPGSHKVEEVTPLVTNFHINKGPKKMGV